MSLEAIEGHLREHKEEIARMCVEGVTAEQMVTAIVHACSENPYLAKCSPASALSAAINGAQIGFYPTGVLGLAYLIPRKNQICYQVGYKGYIKLMRQTPDLRMVEGRGVWDIDEFEYQFGTDPLIRHRPGDSSKRQKLVNAYGVATYTDGQKQFAVLEPEDIKAIMKSAQGTGKADSPWKTFPETMWAKSAINRLSNHVELTTHARVAIAYDNLVETGKEVNVTDIQAEQQATDAAARAHSETKVAGMQGQLEDAKKKQAVKSEIGALIEGANLERIYIGHFAQTTFGHREDLVDEKGRVAVTKLSLAELGDLKKAVEMGTIAIEGGQEVVLDNYNDPGKQFTLEPKGAEA